MSDLVEVFLLALLAMFNPTLLAAVTLMLLLPKPKLLMLGYLFGAYTASISAGLLIVFALPDSSATSTAKSTLSPAGDIVLGLLLLLIAAVLGTDRVRPLRERRKNEKQVDGDEEKEALPMRMLGRGSPRLAFVVGLLLSFPGVAYLSGLNHIHKLDAAAPATVLLVVAFCLIQQLLLEVPLAGYFLRPEKTADAVDRFRAWLARNGRRAGIAVAAALGALLLVRGIVGLG